jgi:hypothetical protein
MQVNRTFVRLKLLIFQIYKLFKWKNIDFSNRNNFKSDKNIDDFTKKIRKRKLKFLDLSGLQSSFDRLGTLEIICELIKKPKIK